MKSNYSIVTFIIFLLVFVESNCLGNRILNTEDNLNMQNNFQSNKMH
jgi:hypothetical protein